VVDVDRREDVEKQSLEWESAPLHTEHRNRTLGKDETKLPERTIEKLQPGSPYHSRASAADWSATHEADGTEK